MSSSVPAASASAAATEPVALLDAEMEMSGSDSEWIQIKDEAVTVHDQAIREEQETTPFLAEAQVIESDNKPLSEKVARNGGRVGQVVHGQGEKEVGFRR